MSSDPVKETPVAASTMVEPITTKPIVDAATTETDIPTIESETAVVDSTIEGPKAVEDEAVVEASPVSEGVLGYKAPGLIKSLRFSKKYFWLGEEAVEESALASYIRGEKSDSAHANAAFASQTGKGLLLYVKRVEDKTSPAGILNLADVTDIAKEDAFDFSFKLAGHKHSFQAKSKAERDGWFVALEMAIEEAKNGSETVVESEGYTSQLAKYTKPAGAAAVSLPKKSEDKVHDGTTASETTATTDTTTTPKVEKPEKSRSQSRKRQSIFGGFMNKGEAKKEEKTEDKEDNEETPVLATDAVVEPVVAEEAAPATEVVEAPVTTNDTTSTTTPIKSKRASVFGGFFKPKKDEKKEEAKEDAAPTVPAKDTEPVAAEAPQLDPVDTTVPVETTTAPVETEGSTTAAALVGLTPATPASTATTPKEKSGFFGFLKQKEAQHEVKKEEKKEVKAEDKEDDKIETPEVAAEVVTPAAETPVIATTTPTTPKDKRRSSFFGSLASKIDRKSETTSDAEGTDGEKKPTKLQGLFRKSSKATKPTTGPVTDSSTPPAIPADAEEASPAAGTSETVVPITNGDAEAAPAEATVPVTESEALPTVPAVTASA